MELHQLEQLVTIANAKTLSKAAEELLISQPALTRSIQKLEEELGLQLFHRSKNKITLNDNGILAVELAKDLLKQADDMVHTLHVHERSQHTITIGSIAPAPKWMLEKVMKDKYPDMQINAIMNSQVSFLYEGLKNKEFSIIITHQKITDENLCCVDLFNENLYISLPPAHPLALFDDVSFQDLDGESVLLLSKIGFWNELCVDKLPHSHLLFQDDQSIYQELTKMSALPYFRSNITLLTDDLSKHRINIPLRDDLAHVHYYAIYHQDNHHLFDFIKEKVKTIDWKTIL